MYMLIVHKKEGNIVTCIISVISNFGNCIEIKQMAGVATLPLT